MAGNVFILSSCNNHATNFDKNEFNKIIWQQFIVLPKGIQSDIYKELCLRNNYRYGSSMHQQSLLSSGWGNTLSPPVAPFTNMV